MLALLSVLLLVHHSRPVKPIALTKVIDQIKAGQVRSITLNDATDTLTATLRSGKHEVAGYPLGYGTHLVERFASTVSFSSVPTPTVSLAYTMVRVGLPILLLVGAMFFLLRVAMPSSRSKAASPLGVGQIPTTRLADVAGADEVVDEMREVVQYLADPETFARAGAHMPHGFLLVGPPGTGKTLLARAVAGEAGVPFFALAGSDFMDTYVGVGAGKVRRVFAKARKAGRAIVFIDEIDAVARTRAAGATNAATDESDRTLNALLVEMDGFAESQVIVLGATNRPEVLDPALLRHGRFDRKITMNPPDRPGRQRILESATQGMHLADDVDLAGLSRRTASLTGADLAFLANEAALTAARDARTVVSALDFDHALEVTHIGRARTSIEVSDVERTITAYHEAGHATLGLALPDADRPVRVSIVPHGPAGGATWMEADDRHFITRSHALDSLAVLLGGRAGEHRLLGDNVTSGAANDLAVAAQTARRMIAEWGLSDDGRLYVDPTAAAEDSLEPAINDLLTSALRRARSVLDDYAEFHQALSERLLEDEAVGIADLEDLLASHPPSSATPE